MLSVSAKSWSADSPEGRFYSELRRVRMVTGPEGEFILPGGLTPGLAATEVVMEERAWEVVIGAIAEIAPVNWSGRTAVTPLLWRSRERLPVSPSVSVDEPA